MAIPATWRERVRRQHRAVRRVVLSRRRLLAAVLAGLAVVAAVREARPPDPPVVALLVAARDLPSGRTLVADDLRPARFAAGTEPAGVVAQPVGRVLAGPVRAGEPVTDVRLVGPSLATAYPGSVAMPVRLPDAAMAGLLRPGDRIDLVAADPQGSTAHLVGTDLAVVALPPVDDAGSASGLPGRLVVLAVPPAAREALAQAGTTGFLTFAYSH